jgi:hypothetical protein
MIWDLTNAMEHAQKDEFIPFGMNRNIYCAERRNGVPF